MERCISLLILSAFLFIGCSPAQQTPTLTIGSIIVSDKDGMTLLYVPAGEFIMGSDNIGSEEKPIHTVYLDAFWIDQSEVTNKMYSLCVDTGVCKEPNNPYPSPDTHPNNYGNSNYDNYPVTYVDWNMAKYYCAWAGRRLPTEAEWEKAARGTDGRTYPWGNEVPDNNLLNHNSAVGDNTEVGKYPNGASIYGALDMAGNVWEWVNDWYLEIYYSSSPSSNPLGPDSGTYRVIRGGSWGYVIDVVRSDARGRDVPWDASYVVGFRCAVTTTS